MALSVGKERAHDVSDLHLRAVPQQLTRGLAKAAQPLLNDDGSLDDSTGYFPTVAVSKASGSAHKR